MSLIDKYGHYQVHSELGRGGMAVVYKCWEESLNRFVAIKVLSDHLAHDQEIKERFLREAKSMAAISHSNIINIHFIGEQDGQPFFAMEYIQGKSLDEILKPNMALSLNHAKSLLFQACEGLQAAHDFGLIHRDIKPGNLMIANDGILKLADFGIAQSKSFDSNLTRTGELVGTPGYLSPEACVGEDVDNRSDIYALGIVFYQMLSGSVPFDTSSPFNLLMDIVDSNILNIHKMNNEIDEDTAFILQKMINRDPQARFQNCQEIMDALGANSNKYSIKTISANFTKVQAYKNVSNSNEQATQNNIKLEKKAVSSLTKRLMHFFNRRKSTVITIVLLTLSLLYYVLSKNEISTESDLSTDFVSNDILLSNQQFYENNTTSIITPSEDLTSEISGNNLQLKEENITPINTNYCLEIAAIRIIKKEKGSWSLKKTPNPAAELLFKLRKQIVMHMQNNPKLAVFDIIKNKCPTQNRSYRLLIEITAYKKPGKVIPKTGLGKEKISINASLIMKKSNKIIAQKRLVGRGVTLEISKNNSEFLAAISTFVKLGIE
jgi:serine/threonine protein kinase